jgi:hypothetical protein
MDTRFHTSPHCVTFVILGGSAKTAARTQTGLTVFGDMPAGATGPALAARRAP